MEEPYYMPNSLRLCIDSRADGNMGGRLYSTLNKNEIEFCDIMNMFTQADKMFDEKGYPQSYQDKRSFQKTAAPSGFRMNPIMERKPVDIINQKGKIQTFDIAVVTRRNTTWQGTIYDFQGKSLGTYKDILQILSILEDFMGSAT